MSNNRIESIDSNAFLKGTIKFCCFGYLYLTNNLIRKIDVNAFQNLPGLVLLKLNDNMLVELVNLNSSFFHELNVLDMSNASLTTFPYSFIGDYIMMNVLNLGSNRIEKLSSMHFVRLKQLERLGNNLIRSVDAVEGLFFQIK